MEDIIWIILHLGEKQQLKTLLWDQIASLTEACNIVFQYDQSLKVKCHVDIFVTGCNGSCQMATSVANSDETFRQRVIFVSGCWNNNKRRWNLGKFHSGRQSEIFRLHKTLLSDKTRWLKADRYPDRYLTPHCWSHWADRMSIQMYKSTEVPC